MKQLSKRLLFNGMGTMAVAAGTPLAAFALSDPTPVASVAQPDRTVDAGLVLAAAITRSFPPTVTPATAAEYEAFIVFVLSQADYSPDIIDAALTQVEAGAGDNANIKIAVENVRRALKRKTLPRGTAALARGGGGLGVGGFGGGGFSAPSVSVGGGSTNYTS